MCDALAKKVLSTDQGGEWFQNAMDDQRTSLVQSFGKLLGRWRVILSGIKHIGSLTLEDHRDRAHHLFRRDEAGRNDPEKTHFAGRGRRGGRLRKEPGRWLGCLADHNVLHISSWFVFFTKARL
jgi:hypothetical protein